MGSVVVHLVLFRPRIDLSESARTTLEDALSTVLRDIPTIRRVRIGHRVSVGRGYEALMRADYSHAAILEFDDVSGLRMYLDHPSHRQLAERFFESFEEALFYDYEMGEVPNANDDLVRTMT